MQEIQVDPNKKIQHFGNQLDNNAPHATPTTKAEDAIFQGLSDREREVLGKLILGLTNVEIGRELFISEKTVRNQLTRIFEKLGVGNRSQAIVFARDHGFRERQTLNTPT